MTTLYYAAACQTGFACPASREEITERTSHMCKMAEQAITGYEPFHDVRLLAFPEFAHAAPIYDSMAKLRDRLAVPIPVVVAPIDVSSLAHPLTTENILSRIQQGKRTVNND